MVMPKTMTTDEMVTRSYNVVEDFVDRMNNASSDLKNQSAGEFGGGGGGNDSGEGDQENDWKAFFSDLGVTWPNASKIKYIKALGKLRVTNTEEQLAILEDAEAVVEHLEGVAFCHGQEIQFRPGGRIQQPLPGAVRVALRRHVYDRARKKVRTIAPGYADVQHTVEPSAIQRIFQHLARSFGAHTSSQEAHRLPFPDLPGRIEFEIYRSNDQNAHSKAFDNLKYELFRKNEIIFVTCHTFT